MAFETVLTIILSIATLASLFISYYFHIRKKLSDAAIGAINSAEDTDKVGKEKFELAVSEVMSLIPTAVKPFITQPLVEAVVQKAFNEVESYAKKQQNKTV